MSCVPEIRLRTGDITHETVDVVVNAANSSLLGGGGVDGAIHARGGPVILAECRQIRRERYATGLPVGEAVATTAGDLPAHWVVHTVGPVWSASHDQSDLLAACHRNSLAVADELGATSIAFPAISTGVYGYPQEAAAEVALATVRECLPGLAHLQEIRFVLFSQQAYDTWAEVFAR
ncbi:MAG: O-acetyl-ADP-ribose deacetylase [Frankiales bacterium]|nr:O-acetyl-ADP-ribose deacetylase [Frankiales bacterium]